MYRDLPDEQLVRRLRRSIGGNPAHWAAVALGHDAGRREMRALKKVAIGRVGVERRAFGDQPRDRGTILGPRHPEGRLPGQPFGRSNGRFPSGPHANGASLLKPPAESGTPPLLVGNADYSFSELLSIVDTHHDADPEQGNIPISVIDQPLA
jgi:hypothetical protein